MITKVRERSLFMTGGGGGGGGGTEEGCFSCQNFADSTIKKSKKCLPNLKYNLKKVNTLPWPKKDNILSHISFTTSVT